EAIQVALQARLKNRDLPQPYLILGLAQMQQKNYERAVEHFDQSIALKPDQPLAYFQMGMAYLFLNEPAKAAQAAERAVELELAKKPEPAPKREEEEKDEESSKKQEDYQVIGLCIGQWNRMKDAVMREHVEEALTYYSDYLDTRDQYRDSFNKMGVPHLKTVFANFGELYDCDVVFASAHCKAVVSNAAGTSVVTQI